jgi:hypothetical protein
MRDHLDTKHVPCIAGQTEIEILQQPPELHYERIAYVEAFVAFYASDDVRRDPLRRELCRQALEGSGDAIIELRVGEAAGQRVRASSAKRQDRGDHHSRPDPRAGGRTRSSSACSAG